MKEERKRRRGWMGLCLLFALSIPLVTPYLRGDGNGYYAWLRSSVIDHDLQFTNDYRHADPVFRRTMFDEEGRVRAKKRTTTGHVDDHWGVGAAVMWAPFFLGAHAFVTVGRLVGLHWQANGFSIPYRWASAFGTALYAFLSMLIAYHLARRRVSDRPALLGVIYQYLLPFWPFGAAAFVGAALLALWDRDGPVTTRRWLAMGALAGLAFAIHPVAVAWGALPLLSVAGVERVREKLRALGLLGIGAVVGAAPQLIGKAIVYGSPFDSGYKLQFLWIPSAVFRNLFGANHGLFSWTPIALIAIVGLAWPLRHRDRRLAWGLLGVFVVMVGIVAFFQFWEQSSYGNRFFVAYTPGFVIGVAAVFESFRGRWRQLAVVGTAALIVWNVLFAFQWAWGMTRKQGPVNWGTVASNQVTRAPREFVHAARLFVTNRGALIRHVQQVDIQRRREGKP